MKDILLLQSQAEQAINKTENLAELDAIRVLYLGKKGKLTDVLKSLGKLSAEQRPKTGQLINKVKTALNKRIEDKSLEIKEINLQKELESGKIDVTLAGRKSYKDGCIHPVTQIKYKINEYFKNLGFNIMEGPEIETEFYNFEALNIPSHHPARAMHDTFYFGDGHLLRTHTSPVQIRAMEKTKPPYRIIAPGRVYRCDSDLTHTPMFNQVEGLMIDNNVTMADLHGLLKDFFVYFFKKEVQIRFRPSYFPFTEPSAEVDIQCTQCSGDGCRSCKFSGWLEVLGCGMVHPNVLKAVNIDAQQYQGWAFGMGIDRLAMLYFGIDDLRKMFENDMMFLCQF